MTDDRKPLHPLGGIGAALGMVSVTVGMVGWMWTLDWRWAASGVAVGLVVFLALGVVGSTLTPKQ